MGPWILAVCAPALAEGPAIATVLDTAAHGGVPGPLEIQAAIFEDVAWALFQSAEGPMVARLTAEGAEVERVGLDGDVHLWADGAVTALDLRRGRLAYRLPGGETTTHDLGLRRATWSADVGGRTCVARGTRLACVHPLTGERTGADIPALKGTTALCFDGSYLLAPRTGDVTLGFDAETFQPVEIDRYRMIEDCSPHVSTEGTIEGVYGLFAGQVVLSVVEEGLEIVMADGDDRVVVSTVSGVTRTVNAGERDRHLLLVAEAGPPVIGWWSDAAAELAVLARPRGDCRVGDCTDGVGTFARTSAPGLVTGEFRDGLPHGLAAVVTPSDGRPAVSDAGRWERGLLVADCDDCRIPAMLPSGGLVQEGHLRGGLQVGAWRETRDGVVQLVVSMVDGAIFGTCETDCSGRHGRILREDGYYEGELLHGVPEGEGTWKLPEHAFTGTWRDGKPVKGELRRADGRLVFRGEVTPTLGKVDGEFPLPDGEHVWIGRFDDDGRPHGSGRVRGGGGPERSATAQHGEITVR